MPQSKSPVAASVSVSGSASTRTRPASDTAPGTSARPTAGSTARTQPAAGAAPRSVSGQLAMPGAAGARVAGPAARKITIATPAYRDEYSGAYVRSLFALLSAAARSNISFAFSEIDYADIVTARNYLISHFYFNQPESTHLLFLDNDMGFPPRLIQHMVLLDQPVVGVLYPRRQVDFRRLHGASGSDFDRAYNQALDFIGEPREAGARSDFVEVDACGTGIMLIARECVRTMIEKCPEIVDHKRFRRMPFGGKFKAFLTPFNKVELDDAELSEDFSFCWRWRVRCGGKIFANLSQPVQHVGKMTVEGRYLDRV